MEEIASPTSQKNVSRQPAPLDECEIVKDVDASQCSSLTSWFSKAWTWFQILIYFLAFAIFLVIPLRGVLNASYDDDGMQQSAVCGQFTARRADLIFDPGPTIVGMSPVQMASSRIPVTLVKPHHKRVRIPARSIVSARVKHQPRYGWAGGHAIFNPGGAIQNRYPGLAFPRSLLTFDANSVSTVRVMNTSDHDIRLSKRLVIGHSDDAMMYDVCSFDSPFREDDRIPLQVPSMDSILEDTQLDKSPLTDMQRKRARALLAKYQRSFAINPKSPTPTPHFSHTIDLRPGARPIAKPPYKVGVPDKRAFVEEKVNEYLQAGIIRPSRSPWASPVVVAKKRDSKEKYRFCVDSRALNSVTLPRKFPLPRIDDVLNSLGGNSYWCTLDMAAGYHQIPMAERDIEKTAFITHHGLYEFVRMPFGLSGATSTFQRAMNVALAGLSWRICLAFLDDVIIFGPDFDTCLRNADTVLERLQSYGMSLKASKCRFFVKEVEYLGHVITPDGIMPNNRLTTAIRDWPQPKNLRQLRAFLGTANYYRKFIPDYSTIVAPLVELTQKNRVFTWEAEQEAAFAEVKTALVSKPLLRYPDYSKPFILHTDASLYGLGCVVSQKFEDGQEHPVHYLSRSLSRAERKWAIREIEALAILWACEENRHLIGGNEFTVVTDHHSLQWLMTTTTPGRLQRWSLRLQEFMPQMSIVYRRGEDNGNADGLSRRGCPLEDNELAELCDCDLDKATPFHRALHEAGVLSSTHGVECNCYSNVCAHGVVEPEDIASDWNATRRKDIAKDTFRDVLAVDRDYDDIFVPRGESANAFREEQSLDARLGPIARALASGKYDKHLETKYETNYELYNGLLYRWARKRGARGDSQLRRRLAVPLSLVPELLVQAHSSRLSGHCGKDKVLADIERRFWWSTMAADVAKQCRGCAVCQYASMKKPKQSGLLQPKMIIKPGDCLSIDLLGPFVRGSSGEWFILTMVDVASRYTVVVATSVTTADRIADLVFKHWIKYFTLPVRILSDQGVQFESALFNRMCSRLGIKKSRTTTYHPQTNAQAERFHRFLLPVMQALVDGHPTRWPEYLDYAMFAYNTHDVAGVGLTPHQMMFARDARLPLDLMASSDFEFSVDARQYHLWHTRALRDVLAIIKAAAANIAAKNKLSYNARHKPVEFSVGQEVLLLMPPNVKGSRKLEPYVRGPFKVVGKNENGVNYTVRLIGHEPPIEKNVHVSHLMKFEKARVRPVHAKLTSSNETWQVRPTTVEPSESKQQSDSAPEETAPAQQSTSEEQFRVLTNATNPRVWIDKSTIPGAVYGLFARKPFKKNQVLCEYKGETLSKREFTRRYPNGDGEYCVRVGRGYIDSADPAKASAARYANGTAPGISPNVLAHTDKSRVYLVAARDILPGEEILWDYGSSYPWKPGQPNEPSGEVKKPPPLLQIVGKMVHTAMQSQGVKPTTSTEVVQDKHVDEAEFDPNDPEEPKTGALKVGDYVVACDRDNGKRWVVQVISTDPILGEFVETHILGSYDQPSDIYRRRWRKAYVDPRDGKCLFTDKPHPRMEPWTWTVEPPAILSESFQLVKGRIPREVEIRDYVDASSNG